MFYFRKKQPETNGDEFSINKAPPPLNSWFKLSKKFESKMKPSPPVMSIAPPSWVE